MHVLQLAVTMKDEATNTPPLTLAQELKSSWRFVLRYVGGAMALMWALELVDQLFLGQYLDTFGIWPRSLRGLLGIAAAPFLHGDFSHLMHNTLPFLVMGWLVFLRGRGAFFFASIFTAMTAGLGAWAFGGGNSVHIGASGVIFGYLGFLLAGGWFERRIGSLFLSVVVGGLYGGLILGVLPSDGRVSWQGHLFGFLGGLLAAWLWSKRKRSVAS